MSEQADLPIEQTVPVWKLAKLAKLWRERARQEHPTHATDWDLCAVELDRTWEDT